MTMTRALRQLLCRGLIGLMLFTQLAIGAYACPVLPRTTVEASDQGALVGDSDAQVEQTEGMAGMGNDVSAAPMVPCDQMAGAADKASPNLCAEHCHYGQQSAQVHAPSAPAVALVSLYTVALTVMDGVLPMSATAESVDSVAMAPPPPHTILHCCIRD